MSWLTRFFIDMPFIDTLTEIDWLVLYKDKTVSRKQYIQFARCESPQQVCQKLHGRQLKNSAHGNVFTSSEKNFIFKIIPSALKNHERDTCCLTCVDAYIRIVIERADGCGSVV